MSTANIYENQRWLKFMQCTYLSMQQKEVCCITMLRLLLDVTFPSTCKCSECILLLKWIFFSQFETQKCMPAYLGLNKVQSEYRNTGFMGQVRFFS